MLNSSGCEDGCCSLLGFVAGSDGQPAWVASAPLRSRQAGFVELGPKMQIFGALAQVQHALQPSRIYFLKEPG